MVGIQTQEEYNEIIESLAKEFDEEIADDAAVDIAWSIIASFNITDDTPHIGLSTTVWGGKNKALDTALLPSEVLLYTDSSITNIDEDDSREKIAAEALINDLEKTQQKLAAQT